MAKLVIKKRVSLDFLGDDYKDAYLTFKGIPVKDYSKILAEMPNEESGDNAKAIELMLKCLTDYFIEGKFPNDKGELESVSAEDVADSIDQATAITCFERLVGGNPKVES